MSLATWNPFQRNVQGGHRAGDYTNGMYCLLASGPPFVKNLGAAGLSGNTVYPMGLTQNLAISQNLQVTKIFEIGSDRTYMVAGRSVGQLSLARVWISGPSMLRALYAYYSDRPSGTFPQVRNLMGDDANFFGLETPYLAGPSGGDQPLTSDYLHDVEIPPGFENFYPNLASDLFKQPTGILFICMTSSKQPVGAFYLEQCMLPSYNWALDASGLIFQESVGIQYERMVPLNIRAISLLRGLLEGGSTAPQFTPSQIATG